MIEWRGISIKWLVPLAAALGSHLAVAMLPLSWFLDTDINAAGDLKIALSVRADKVKNTDPENEAGEPKIATEDTLRDKNNGEYVTENQETENQSLRAAIRDDSQDKTASFLKKSNRLEKEEVSPLSALQSEKKDLDRADTAIWSDKIKDLADNNSHTVKKLSDDEIFDSESLKRASNEKGGLAISDKEKTREDYIGKEAFLKTPQKCNLSTSTGSASYYSDDCEKAEGYLREYLAMIIESIRGEQRYPRAARRLGLEGELLMQIDIDAEGRIAEEPIIIDSSGIRMLDREALRMTRAAEPFLPFSKMPAQSTATFRFSVAFKLVPDT